MKQILLCRPDYYQIEYVINPWMDLSNKVDTELVKKQYQELKSTYEKLGVPILEIKPRKGLPDMVFAANLGYVEGKMFVAANFKYPQRRAESELAKKFFAERGFEVVTLSDGAFFEGEGDLFKVGDSYVCGWGKRTSREAIVELQKILGKPILDLELVDEFYYHLDTAFAPLSPEICVINPKSFRPEDLKKLRDHFRVVIEASPQDNKVMACNLVVVDKTIVVGKGISQQLKAEFKRVGFDTIEVDTSEYLKGGGSVKCLSLEFEKS